MGKDGKRKGKKEGLPAKAGAGESLSLIHISEPTRH